MWTTSSWNPWRAESIRPSASQPHGRDAAGGGLALADLVAIEDQDVGPGARELAGDRQPGEAGAADEDVVVARRAGSARRPAWWLSRASEVERIEPGRGCVSG